MKIYVYGIEWDMDESIQLDKDLILKVSCVEYERFTAKEDIDIFVEEEISRLTGFCHNGYDGYNIEN